MPPARPAHRARLARRDCPAKAGQSHLVRRPAPGRQEAGQRERPLRL